MGGREFRVLVKEEAKPDTRAGGPSQPGIASALERLWLSVIGITLALWSHP